MPRAKLFVFSILFGVMITAALTMAAFSVQSTKVAGLLLWQVMIVGYLVGPGPRFGHDAQGNQLYEGTPIHLLVLPVGLLLAVASYSILSYFLLRAKFGIRDGPSERR